MRKGLLFLVLTTSIFLGVNTTVFSQLAAPLTIQPACAVNPGPLLAGDPAGWAEVVISEVTGDAGQSDSVNDALVELAGPPGTDIGGFVVTNGEWAVILPMGTLIPPDGVFILGCGFYQSKSSFTTTGSGLTCAECDYPGMCLDFDVCASFTSDPGLYVSFSFDTYSFTLDNGACDDNADGDQVLLFRPDGTPHDGIFWGRMDDIPAGGTDMTLLGGSSGDCGSPADHISIQDGAYYLLGDNDENGVVNDVIQTHTGRKGDGGNATGVSEMPLGDYDPDLNGMTNAQEVCFVMPPMNDPSGVWVYAGCAPTSCNSVYMRIDGSNGDHCIAADDNRSYALNPSHMDDGPRIVSNPSGPGPCTNDDITTMTLDPSCALDTDWANNSSGGGGVPSGLDAAGALAQWGYSDHPNPGQPNDANSWDFSFDYMSTSGAEDADGKLVKGTNTLNVCEGGTIKFTLQVFNNQHVEPTVMADQAFYTKTIGSKAGSFVVDETGATVAWDDYQAPSSTASTDPSNNTFAGMPTLLASADDGTTTMCYTSVAPMTPGTYTYILVWDDFTALGSGSTSTVEGRAGNPMSQHECYEDVIVTINVLEAPDLVTDTDISCPGDFDVNIGSIDFSQFISNIANTDVTFELYDNNIITIAAADADTPDATSTSGFFNLLSSYTGDLAVVIRDNTGCGTDQIITIDNACTAAPPCPEITMSSASSTGAVCPGDEICFQIDAATDLPVGGTIDFYIDGMAGFDPYMGDGMLLGSAIIEEANGVSGWTLTGFESTGNGSAAFVSGNNGAGSWTNQTSGGGASNSPGVPNDGTATPYSGSDIVINEVLYDGPNDCDGGNTSGAGAAGEYIEIAGPPGTDISCFQLSDGDFTIVIPSGTTIPADGIFLIAADQSMNANCPPTVPPAEIDLNLGTCACISGTNFTFTNESGSGGEYIGIFDASGQFLNGVAWGAADFDDFTTESNHPCAGTESTTPPSIAGCSAMSVEIPQPDVCPNLIGEDPEFCFTFDETFCNIDGDGDFFITGIINPFTEDIVSGCLETNPESSTDEFAFNMTCPEITITPGQVDLCAPGSAIEVTVMVTNGPAVITYDINGVQTTVMVPDGTSTLQLNDGMTPTSGVETFTLVSGFADNNSDTTQDTGECNATVDSTLEFEFQVSAAPEASLTSATEITGCDPKAGGEVTITFEGGTGPFEFEYQDPSGNVIQAVGGSGNCSGGGGTGSSTIYTQAFDALNDGYISVGYFSQGASDYFDLIGDGMSGPPDNNAGNDATGVPAYTGFSGNFWSGEDTNDNGAAEVGIDITGIDISCATGNIEVCGLFAANGDFEASTDFLELSAQVDGGGFNIISTFDVNEAETQDGVNDPFEDTSDGTNLGLAAAQFCFPVTITGNTLDLSIRFLADAGGESIAFDEITVTADGCDSTSGDCTATFTVCEPGTYTLLSITNESGCPGTVNTATVEVTEDVDFPTVTTNVGTYDCTAMSSMVTVTINNTGTGPGTDGYTITGAINDTDADPGANTYTISAGGTITVRDEISGCEINAVLSVGDISSCDDFTCPTLSNPSADQTICETGTPSAFTAEIDLNDIDVEFVYFTTAQTGTAMYTGGTQIGTAQTPTGAAAPFGISSGTTGFPTAPGTYFIYAILDIDDADLTDASCRPFLEFELVIEEQSEAGTDGSTTICVTSTTTIDLATLITGEDTGGTWVAGGANPAGGTFTAGTGMFDPTGVMVGTYTFTYSFAAGTACVADMSTATVMVTDQPEAGTPSNTTICETSTTAIDLFAQLAGEDTGGTWTAGGANPAGGTFTAGTGMFDPTGAGVGTYSFTYSFAAAGGCAADDATVMVTVEEQSEAGTDGSTTICVTSTTTIDLATLLTGEDTGGTWVAGGANPAGGTFTAGTGMFDPTGVMVGTYTFTYSFAAGTACVADMSTATVMVTDQPEAGTPSNTTICETSTTAIDLFAQLAGEDTGGTWTAGGANPAGGTFTAGTGMFDPTGAGVGTYSFTYSFAAAGGCAADDATVMVTVEEQSEAGTDGSTTICVTSTTTIDLATLITGEDTGGTWVAGGANPAGGTFTAGTGMFDPTGVSLGTYTFTYSFAAGTSCIADMSTATVMVTDQPEAGTPSNTEICESSTTVIDLFDLLAGEDTGGTWTAAGTNPAGGTFTAATGMFDPTGSSDGSYTFTYSFAATGGCAADDAMVMVIVNALPDAPMVDDFSVCAGGDQTITPPSAGGMVPVIPSDLFFSEYIEGSGNNKCLEIFNGTGATVDLSNYTIKRFSNGSSTAATFTMSGMLNDGDVYVVCNGSATSDFTDLANETSGVMNFNGDDAISLCNDVLTTTIDIIGNIGCDPGSEWSGAGDGTANNTIIRNCEVSAGITMDPANAPCDFPTLASEWTGLSQNDFSNLGSHTYCAMEQEECLFNFYDADPAGGAANLLANEVTSYTPTIATGMTESFFVTKVDDNDCESLADQVDVTIITVPEVTDIADVTVCDTYTLPTIMGTNLTGNEGFFTMSGGMGTQLAVGDMITTSQTIFIYDATGTTPDCTDEESFMVTVNLTPDVTDIADVTVCDSYTLPTIMGSNLTGNEGYYTMIGGMGTQLAVGDMITTSQTIYIYDATGTTPDCTDEESFMVTVNLTPDVTDITDVTVCDDYTLPTITGSNLTGNEGFYTMSGGMGTQLAVGDMITTSQTIYIYDATGTTPDCTDEESFMVTVNTTPDVTDIADVTVCDSYTLPTITGTGLTGNEGFFTMSGGMGTQLAVGDMITTSQTIYIYDATGTTPDCTDEESFMVTVSSQPEAGTNGMISLCSSDATATMFDLYDLLTGADTGGTWSETTVGTMSGVTPIGSDGTVDFSNIASGTYEFTYEIDPGAPCVADMSIVTVTIECFDLALTKILTPGGPSIYSPGDMVSFDITVYNQGDLTAYDIEVTDYFTASELIYNSATFTSYSTGGTAIIVDNGINGYTIDEIAAGENVVVTLIFTISSSFTGTQIVNNAEITFGTDTDGDPISTPDEDSTPDDNSTDPPEFPTDNEMEDGPDDPTDEDDFDPALIPLCPADCDNFPWDGNE